MSAYTFKLAALVLAAVSAVSAQSVPVNCDRLYEVQSGDTCDAIGAAQDVPTFQLTTINTQIDATCSNLFIGEVLCLGLSGQDCETVHVVQSGDNCVTIAANAGIPLSTLLANNKNIDANCDNITIGEVLCTASQIFTS